MTPVALARSLCILLGSERIRFWGDHCFLKEPGSKIRTAFHQDAPYFPFTGDDACVCWVPVDSVSKESGAMGYIKGSHKWPEYSPNALVSNDRTHDDTTPTLPKIEGNESKYDIMYFDAEPGDVIIHYPRTCHGSRGNTTLNQRRLAASLDMLVMMFVGLLISLANGAAGHLLGNYGK